MKHYKKLLLLFLIIITLSCILAPIVKISLDFMLEKGELFADSVNYENGIYDFGKVMRRILMLAACIVFVILRKSLKIGPLMALGMTLNSGCFRKFLFGFLIAIISLLIYYSLALYFGAWLIHIDYHLVGIVISKIIKYFLVGCLIGLIEEVFFRGFILQFFMEDMSVAIAICATSAIYSVLHFFQAEVPVTRGFQPFVGCTTMSQFLQPLFSQFTENLPSIIGLFLVGVVLSYGFLLSKSLFLSIGLHSGWVFMMKVDGLFLVRVREKYEWVFGNSNQLVTGFVIWSSLICILCIIKKVYRNTHNFEAYLK
ncbi:MAG: CPBP family intramembrane metalloprotease [Candidatus Scalindua sp. AMX11]|nr:MAG: CPBP family intramembrane metalloprotease [Candidatus Scalindua sp.]NOG82614.1 CPBP family intramembrane metalloprotease [Planctomycetota bacterium]RZV78311.1 MAG: CPBP family intramembrane metalloprotease [Candidatus Scalindua sp. SCAELEC01]TDE65140.1 MAG: CPBP family intramembrane metalloprotease [Candidatus Scalindua sp. AMX11]